MRNVSEEMLIGASDGSAKYETGTGSWCITINKQMFAWSQIPIDGKQPDSHRAECLALISLLTFLDILSTRMSIHTRSIIIIDCESILKVTNQLHTTPETIDQKHRHLQTKIHDLLKKNKSKLKHIHSHQDKVKDILTFEEKLNQFCDKKCENFYKEWSPDMLPKPVPIKIPDIPHLAIKNIPIYENFYKALSIQKYEPRIREKFEKLGNLPHIFDK